MVKKFLFTLLIILTVFSLKVDSTLAQGNEEEFIENFDVKIVLHKDGYINVNEKITYNFGPNKRRGIIRKIPFVYTNQENQKFKLNFKDFKVLNEEFVINKSSTENEIKIGNRNTFLTGKKIYNINYKVENPLLEFSDHIELFWNVTGNNWDAPINNVAYTLTSNVPNINFTNTQCFTGSLNSKQSNCKIGTLKNTITATAQNLQNNQGLTVGTSFNKGLVAINAQQQVGKYNKYFAYLWIFFGWIISPFLVFFYWLFYGRDPKTSPIIVRQYEIPKNNKVKLTPVEVGAIVDEKIHPRDISAEIIDIATKGFINIKEEKGKGYFSSNNIEIKRTNKDLSKLSIYQKDIISALGLDSKKSINTKDLKEDFGVKLQKIKKDLYKDLVTKKYFEKNPQNTRSMWYVLSTFLFIFLPAGAIAGFIFANHMPRKTIKGAKIKIESLGLLKYIKATKRHYSFQEDNLELFEKFLPYAISFGVAKKWSKKFNNFTNYTPKWYSSNLGTFTPHTFTTNLQSNLAGIQKSYSIASKTSSTSGFSSYSGGKGFSGGGFGGGGGSSW